MRVAHVLETSLYVDDLDAAQDYYQRVLGLEVYSRAAERHVFFRCGRAMFLLFNAARTAQAEGDVPTHGARGAGHAAFAMRADEVEQWRAQLREQNVPIEAEIAWPLGGRSLYFRDPSGNSLELATPQMWGLEETA